MTVISIIDDDASVRVATHRLRSGRKDRDRWAGITPAGQDVENHIGGMDAMADGFGTGRLDRRQPIGKHRDEDVDHLSIAIVLASLEAG